VLAPDDRRTLLEALRPPAGYQLDRAVGTTFSLDLQALLLAPLAFTLFGWREEAGRTEPDPLALLTAVRSSAERIHIFCQAGQIAIPGPNQFLLTYLEQSVCEVTPVDRRGVFHPKVWTLRFTASQAGTPICYRLLCLSRNLTFDRSWDTALVLDGEVIDRRYGYGGNQPLAEFVEALPGLAVRPVPAAVRAGVDLIQSELRRVKWTLPEGFTSLVFHPLGHRGRRNWPFPETADRRLVVAPVLAGGPLEQLSRNGRNHVLVSRASALEVLEGRLLARFARIYTLDQALEPEPAEVAEGEGTAADAATVSVPTGLHAKLYVEEVGQEAHVWTGSANATEAAFEHNVEFLAELSGPKSVCGVNAFLDHTRRGQGMLRLLREFRPPERPVAVEPVLERLEKRLQSARQGLVESMLTGTVNALPAPGTYEVVIRRGRPGSGLPARVAGYCWPISVSQVMATAVRLEKDPVARLGPLSVEALTTFVAFELITTEGSRTATTRFVLAVPLSGVPEDRDARLLRNLLHDRHEVLRYLFLLLAGDSEDPLTLLEALGAQRGSRSERGAAGLPLLEALLRALDRNPEKIDALGRFIEDLRRTPEGRELLPPDLEAVWAPVVAVRAAGGRP